jgi:hypothetical protein
MAQLINEAKRFQKLANIQENTQKLSPEEQKVADDILNAGMLEEGKFDPKAILNKMIQWGKKGLLTMAIISSVLSSCGFGPTVEQDLKNKAEEYAKLEKEKDDYAKGLADFQTTSDSTMAVAQGKKFDKFDRDTTWYNHYNKITHDLNSSLDDLKENNIDSVVNEALRKVRLKEATTPPPATPTQKPSGEKLQGGSMGLLIQKFNQLGIENPNLSSVLSRVKNGTKLSPSDNTVLASILTQMLKTSDDKTLMSIFQIFKSIESAK